jgi:hypothetical protein
MPASTIGDTRAALATALATTLATVYSSVPETPIPPAIVIVPDSPYMEPVLLNKSTTKVKLNFANLVNQCLGVAVQKRLMYEGRDVIAVG